jgi:hypothetical protein
VTPGEQEMRLGKQDMTLGEQEMRLGKQDTTLGEQEMRLGKQDTPLYGSLLGRRKGLLAPARRRSKMNRSGRVQLAAGVHGGLRSEAK